MTVITDTAVRRRLSALHAAHAGKGDLLAVARAKLAELTTRKSQLEQRQAGEERQKLPTDSVDDNALATALLDDPTAAIEGDAFTTATAAVASAAAARGAQQARIAIIRSALLKLQPLIVDASRRIEELEGEERDANTELRSAAHDALINEFRSRFKLLTAEVIDPLLVLQRDMKGAGSHLDTDTRVVLNTWHRGEGGCGRYHYEPLLDQSPDANLDRLERSEDVIASFLSSLVVRRG